MTAVLRAPDERFNDIPDLISIVVQLLRLLNVSSYHTLR